MNSVQTNMDALKPTFPESSSTLFSNNNIIIERGLVIISNSSLWELSIFLSVISAASIIPVL
jgi:hypothetical protein